jgi:nitroimidazol reductase NimA-like FMN-containing flavoprotein (pyridoxamine 5'-phosphate oxidase superfamily)
VTAVSDPTDGQKRGRRIAMTAEEIDTFLAGQRTCRVATVGADGPHATPLWFIWSGGCIWLYSITRSRRWAELMADPRIGIVVDDGHDYTDLRGVEITGAVEIVGEVPRTGEVVHELTTVEPAFAAKNFGLDQMFHDQRHAWLRVTPTKIVSWDFRKMADL